MCEISSHNLLRTYNVKVNISWLMLPSVDTIEAFTLFDRAHFAPQFAMFLSVHLSHALKAVTKARLKVPSETNFRPPENTFNPLLSASCKTLCQLPVMTAALLHKNKHLALSDVTNQYGKTSVTSQRADYFQSLKISARKRSKG